MSPDSIAYDGGPALVQAWLARDFGQRRVLVAEYDVQYELEQANQYMPGLPPEPRDVRVELVNRPEDVQHLTSSGASNAPSLGGVGAGSAPTAMSSSVVATEYNCYVTIVQWSVFTGGDGNEGGVYNNGGTDYYWQCMEMWDGGDEGGPGGGGPGGGDGGYSGGGGGPGGGTGGNEAALRALLDADPFALLDIPCSELAKWQDVATNEVPQSVLDRMSELEADRPLWSNITTPLEWQVQDLQYASGTVVNMDYYSVDVSNLPAGVSAGAFFQHVRRNLNNFIDTSVSRFDFYPGLEDEALRWNSNDPMGSICSIQIYLFPGWSQPTNNGTVITTDFSSSHWRFTTVWSPADWAHPVSGTREFGYTSNPDGSYTFYTRGVDRVTALPDRLMQNYLGDPAFEGADALWTSFLEGIRDAVESNGGTASVNGNQGYRPDWEEYADVLTGQEPVSTFGGCTNDLRGPGLRRVVA